MTKRSNPADSATQWETKDAPPGRAVELALPGVRSISALKVSAPAGGQVLCERCGAAMYRMHAVWRCPACGFKTDCRGW